MKPNNENAGMITAVVVGVALIIITIKLTGG